MKWLNNFSIGIRLGFLVAVSIAAIVMAALTGMADTGGLVSEIDFGYQAITRPLAAVAGARGEFNAIRTALHDLAQDSNTIDQNEEFKRQILTNLSDYEGNITLYKVILDKYGTNDPYEAEAVAYLYGQLPLLRANVEHIISIAEHTGKSADAVRFMRGSFLDAADEVSRDLVVLARILEAQTDKANKQASAIGSFNRSVSVAIMAFSLLFLLIIAYIIVRSITRPLKETAAIADAISQGNLETEITISSGTKDEIGILSRSLHRMVEQFRVYIVMQKRTQEYLTIHSQLTQLKQDCSDMKCALDSVSELLCRHFKANKVTIVLDYAGRTSVLSCYDMDSGLLEIDIDNAPDFMYHSQVRALLSNQKIVFSNAFALLRQKITFLPDKTKSACFIPLRTDDSMDGYIIFENFIGNESFHSDDDALLHTAEIISGMLPGLRAKPLYHKYEAHEDKTAETVAEEPVAEETAADTPSECDFITAAKTVDGLDVDMAVETMGGLRDIYEKSLRLFFSLFPASVKKLDDCIQSDLNAFAIEVHGVKGSLRNIGANTLGDMAGELEAAAKAGNAETCESGYPAFRDAFERFYENLKPIFPILKQEKEVKQDGDWNKLIQALSTAKDACEGYDALLAQEALSDFAAFSFDERTDALIKEIMRLLEMFECEKALETIAEINQTIGGHFS